MNAISIIHKILTVAVLFRAILLARLSLLLWEVKGITTAEDCTDKMERRVSETGKLRQQLITNPFTSQECTSEETPSICPFHTVVILITPERVNEKSNKVTAKCFLAWQQLLGILEQKMTVPDELQDSKSACLI